MKNKESVRRDAEQTNVTCVLYSSDMAWELMREGRLTPTAVLLYGVLCGFARKRTKYGITFGATNEWLAGVMGCDVRSINRHLAVLVKMKLVRVFHDENMGRLLSIVQK